MTYLGMSNGLGQKRVGPLDISRKNIAMRQ
jgi:hypothetical protein